MDCSLFIRGASPWRSTSCPEPHTNWILPERFPSRQNLLSWSPGLWFYYLPCSFLSRFSTLQFCVCCTQIFDQLTFVCGRSSKISPLVSFFLDMLHVVCILSAFFWWWFWQPAPPDSWELLSPRVGSRLYVRKNVRDSGLRISSGFLTVWVALNFAILKMKGLWEVRIYGIVS